MATDSLSNEVRLEQGKGTSRVTMWCQNVPNRNNGTEAVSVRGFWEEQRWGLCGNGRERARVVGGEIRGRRGRIT